MSFPPTLILALFSLSKSSYVATLDTAPDDMADPRMAFAFCYIASHFGMGFVTDAEATGILEYVEKHLDELRKMIVSEYFRL